MTYQPFLPEVAAGSIEERHAVVSHRRHLKKTKVVLGKVTNVNHATKTATIAVDGAPDVAFNYDHIVMTAGAVSRTFPIPGVADVCIGLKNIEEAVEVRNRILANFDKAPSCWCSSPAFVDLRSCRWWIRWYRSFRRNAFARNLPNQEVRQHFIRRG
jgi:NADH dehydrogenase